MRRLKRGVVRGLEHACTLFDKVPYYSREDRKLYWSGGGWGCYVLRLCERSLALDERWKTGVWVVKS